jgi:acetyl esterase/lipase
VLRIEVFQLLLMLTAIGVLHPIAKAQFLGPQQVNKPPSSPADHRIKYGKDPLQFGDLRLPETSGRHPVAVVIHGGCWKSGALQSTAALSSALTSGSTGGREASFTWFL